MLKHFLGDDNIESLAGQKVVEHRMAYESMVGISFSGLPNTLWAKVNSSHLPKGAEIASHPSVTASIVKNAKKPLAAKPKRDRSHDGSNAFARDTD
jgi:hypothetical protein